MNAKFDQRAMSANSLVCVGLDSDVARLPARFQTQAQPQLAFNQWIIEETHQFVAAYKPNLAFYEARGAAGWQELKATLEYLKQHHPDIFTIADAKRGDIDSTNVGYVSAIFDDLGFDAITLHPYLGGSALKPFLDRADKTSIILCRTSNPSAGELQDLMVDGQPLWKKVAERVRDSWNEQSNCMVVVGATYPQEMTELRQLLGDMTFLVPGVGAQGGDLEAAVRAGLNTQQRGMIINSARGIIFSENPAVAAQSLRDSINLIRKS